MDDNLRFQQLFKEIPIHAGYRFLSRMNMFDISLYVFTSNYAELRRAIEFLAESEEAYQILGVTNRHKLDAAFGETIRLLHNFVAAANSLIDHTRVLYRDFDRAGKGFSDYQEQIDLLFNQQGLPDFIKGLRQYCLHYKVPGIGIHIEIVNGGKEEHRHVFISKRDLCEFSKWTSPAREFISLQPEEVDILAIFDEYFNLIIEFQNWFRGRLTSAHKHELKEIDSLQREYGYLIVKGQTRILLNNKGAYESVEDAFYDVLNSDQIDHIKSIDNTTARCDALLANIKVKADIDDELEAQIRLVYE